MRSEMNALYNGASVKAVTSSVQELQAIKVDQFCGKYAALDVYGPQNAMARKVLIGLVIGHWGFTALPTLVCLIWAPEKKPGIVVTPCSFR